MRSTARWARQAAVGVLLVSGVAGAGAAGADLAPYVVSIAGGAALEGDPGGLPTGIAFPVSVDRPIDPTDAIGVTFEIVPGTATAGEDYVDFAATITLSGAGGGFQTRVAPIRDTTAEPDETFIVRIAEVFVVGGSGRTATTSPTAGEAVGTILDDDGPGRPYELDAGDGDAFEAEGHLTIPITLDRPVAAGDTVTVHAATHDDVARSVGPDADFTAVDATVTFVAGQQVAEVAVPIADDGVAEPDEVFLLLLDEPQATGPSGVGAAVVDPVGDGTIHDGATAPLPEVSPSRASLREGDGGWRAMRFPVHVQRAFGDPGAAVVVRWATIGLTATAPGDFAYATGTLTFGPGDEERVAVVWVRGDRAREATEHLVLHVRGVEGGRLVHANAVGTVVDDD